MNGAVLRRATQHAIEYRDRLATRPVGAHASAAELIGMLGRVLPDNGCTPEEVIDILAEAARAGTVASSGSRWFGFVVGGTLPVAIAADWLTSAWDNNGRAYALGPLAAVAEQLAADWLVDLLGLPPGTSVGFTSGCTMAHFTALAAARHRLLTCRGWDVEHNGLWDAPRITVLAGQDRHVTVDLALRYLGIGTNAITVIPSDNQGRMGLAKLAHALCAHAGPTIVCAQLGNVNTGACDRLADICALARRAGAWVHIDGAFGLWAAASDRLRPLTHGLQSAHSWATDAHKWLNVPYDCGIVFVADSHAHRAAMAHTPAAYLSADHTGLRDGADWVPEFSRRARAVPVWATLRALGRQGVAHIVERYCSLARLFTTLLAVVPGIEILNDVVLAQILVRFDDSDTVTRQTVQAVQDTGVCWLATTTWQDRIAMRISIASAATSEPDIHRSVNEILQVWQTIRRNTHHTP